jgi:hypothetical protein
MESPKESSVGENLVGRILVVIPSLDFGLMETVTDNVTTSKGKPASTQVELLAIRRAVKISEEKGLKDYVVYSDNVEAVRQAESQHAQWLEVGRIHFASLFLHRVLTRGRYLRHSARKITKRTPTTAAQDEIFQLFLAKSSEFKLSKSHLWNRIKGDLPAVEANRV